MYKESDSTEVTARLKPYKKESDYSYALGAFPTFELLKAQPEIALRVLCRSDFTERHKLEKLCAACQVPFELNDKLVARISNKGNCYVIGVFKKRERPLRKEDPHLILVNPGNMGNLGTIIRTAVGFGLNDLGIILPSADIFDPKTIRASMGAIFRLSFQAYSSFGEYRRQHPRHQLFPFITEGSTRLAPGLASGPYPYALVFGNEATGLDKSYGQQGISVSIPQTTGIDSLNLTVAVGIGLYVFTKW